MAGEPFHERELRAIARAGDRPVTQASIAEDLRALGVDDGMVLLVHASMSAIGWVAGGAQAVVGALIEVLGDEGTLVMPAFSSEWSDPSQWTNPPVPESWWPVIREEFPAFDPAVTPTRQMGAIAECFRTWPGTVRGEHPQESFAARGPAAASIVSGHTLERGLGEGSPLAAIEALGGWVLLLGVGYGNCTSAHLAEYRVDWPGKSLRSDGAAMLVDGERRWVTFEDIDGDGGDFPALGEAFEQEHGDAVRRGPVGAADARLFPQPLLVSFAATWLERNRGRDPG